MMSKTSATLRKLLQRTGYIHNISNNAGTLTAGGPSGALLRQNIFKTWWNRMVTRSDSSFPVYGKNIDPLEFYPEILKLQNQNIPFSIAYSTDVKAKKNRVTEEFKQLLFFEEETTLNFHHFCQPATVNQMFDQIVNSRIGWWKQYSCNASNFTVVTMNEKNSKPILHIQYKFQSEPVTIETVCNLGSDNVDRLEERTGKDCKFYNGKKEILPCQIECRSSVDTAMAVFLNDAYTVSDADEEVLQLHPALAPFKVAILRDGENRRQIQEVALYISRELRKGGLQIIDTKYNERLIEKQIVRYDEMGIPFTVIVDDSTLETGAIKLRNRDTTILETLAINRLVDYVTKHVTYDHNN